MTVINSHENSWFKTKYNRLICYLENNWNIILLATIFLLVSCLLFADYFLLYGFFKEHRGFRKSLGYGASVSRGAAHALSFSYALMLLSVCRNLMTALRNTPLNYYIPVDFAIDFHRFVATFALLLTGIHVIGHGINFYQISTQSLPILQCLVPEIHMENHTRIIGITGVLLVVILSVMYVLATRWARRNMYKAFWLSHRLYIPVFVLTFIHGSYGLLQSPVFPYYVVGPTIIFVIDWIISLRRTNIILRIEKAEALPSEVLHLSFKCPRSVRFCSGQWIGLCCDELSVYEFHPFTITSAPYEQKISLHIRTVGPWTKKLYDLFSGRIANHLPFPKIKMSGPFGSSHQDWLKFEVVVLVGAGIGVTPTASVLKDLVHKVYQQNKEIPCRRVNKVGIFSCGPKSVSRSVDSACQKLNQTMSGPRLIAHYEVF